MIPPIDFNVPETAQKSSYLYEDMRPEEMHGSLATVVLQNGYIIDASWYPPNDPHGTYIVRVLWDRFDEIYAAQLTTVSQVVSAIEDLSLRFDRSCAPYSTSSSTDIEEPVTA